MKKKEIISCFKAYLESIQDYPLLDKDEEIEIGKKIMNGHNLKLIKKDDNLGLTTYSLNLPLLFLSLNKIHSNNEILHILLEFYKDKNNYKQDYNTVKEYLNLCEKKELKENDIIRKYKINSEDIFYLDEKELSKEIKDYVEYKQASEKLFNSNLRLVINLAIKHKQDNNYLMDLISEGNLGLMIAIEKFDFTKGNKFSTYATWWISRNIFFGIRKSFAINIPDYLNKEFLDLKKRIEYIEGKYNRSLTNQELSKELGVSIEFIDDMSLYTSNLASFEKPIANNSDSEFTLKDVVPDEYDIEEDIKKRMLVNDIKELLNILSPKELDVIILRYGLGERKENLNLREIAKILGISHECVRQREINSIKKMRKYVNKNNKDYIYYIKK